MCQNLELMKKMHLFKKGFVIFLKGATFSDFIETRLSNYKPLVIRIRFPLFWRISFQLGSNLIKQRPTSPLEDSCYIMINVKFCQQIVKQPGIGGLTALGVQMKFVMNEKKVDLVFAFGQNANETKAGNRCNFLPELYFVSGAPKLRSFNFS